ncbi:hypothetical protein TTHERM_00052530 (macronuclear) [Tetrahymena thermophila SB210]|uniref:Uncharacterized protein n=1 Tax=Tetrahymena thermophila (strain SB210) TaxID=312017 RepID=Q23CT7_TETTS|nr:hypothetical protein TTHERM_00052530 [Tetrahymena thermophila SB210]EAR94480.2 hypothetical protein TTHERM_00052530 [Tetrahymena thermophila SB210]|eukprot:XP_001014949.2 hypothetical protein TTHERM_00052530 [Tetrahymena thermophila SB210]
MTSLLAKDQQDSNNEQNNEASQHFKFKNIQIDRQYTEDEVVIRHQSNCSQTQIPISLTPIVKQMNFFRKIQINEETFNESAYFISTCQQADAFKVNSKKVSKRCLSPQEKLKQVLYETSSNSQFKEQSIKKYTRRKSCQGGIFGEPSSQIIIREKQFPLGIIVQHIVTIIDENEKRRLQKEQNALKQQKKSNPNIKASKNPSFKQYSGKSIFNSQTSGTNLQFTSFQNNQYHQQQNFQTLQQQSSLLPKFSFFGADLHDRKSINLNQINVFSPKSPNNFNKVNNSSEFVNSSQPLQQQPQPIQMYQGNESLQEINKIQQNSRCQEDVSEPIQISKLEFDTLNQLKSEPEKMNNQSLCDEDDQQQTQNGKTKRQNLQQQGSGQKYNGQESLSSHSSVDLDDNDEGQLRESQKRANNNQQTNYKKNMIERFSFSKDSNRELNKTNSINEFKNIGNNQQLNINFGSNSKRFSVVNTIAPTLQQQVLQRQHSKMHGQAQNDQLQAFMSKYGECQAKKGSFLITNVKKIQESKQLQDVLQEYLEPGSTDNLNYSPSNPTNRTENLKKALISATNMITLQNKVKGNKSFLINYYKLIGKLTIDTNIQYLSQFADDILATPVDRHKQKTLIIRAPKKRKVYIYNTPEDKVKLISQLDKLHLNQKVQKYIHEKQCNDSNQNTSKSTTTGRERAQTSFKSYFFQDKDSEIIHNKVKYTPELKPNKPEIKHYSPIIKPYSPTNNCKFLLRDVFSPTNQQHSYQQDNTSKNRSKSQKSSKMGDCSLKKLLNPDDFHYHDSSSKNSSGKNFFSLSQKNSLAFLDRVSNNASSNSMYFTKAPLHPYLGSLTPKCQNNPKESLLLTSPRNNIKKYQNINQNNLEQNPILNSLNKQHKKNIQTLQNS